MPCLTNQNIPGNHHMQPHNMERGGRANERENKADPATTEPGGHTWEWRWAQRGFRAGAVAGQLRWACKCHKRMQPCAVGPAKRKAEGPRGTPRKTKQNKGGEAVMGRCSQLAAHHALALLSQWHWQLPMGRGRWKEAWQERSCIHISWAGAKNHGSPLKVHKKKINQRET